MTVNKTPKVVFISGISEGVGKSIAIKLSNEGYYVIGISRSEPDYLADYPDIHWFKFDISESFEDERFRAEVEKYSDCLDLLIINAAAAYYGKVLEIPSSELENVLHTNWLASIGMMRALVPMMPPGSQVLFVGSSAEYLPAPNMGIYAALKAAQSHLAQTLSVEYMHSDIQFKVLCPGVINTCFAQNSGVPYDELEAKLGLSPDNVADDLLRLVKKNSFFINSGRVSKLLCLLNKMGPAMTIWLSKRRHGKKV